MKAPSSTQNDILVPFLKWAGGKRWFAERFLDLIPARFDRYLEPFVGSGAMFFALNPSSAILSDLNEDLIDTYIALRTRPDQVQKHLAGHHARHCEEYYYSKRSTKPEDLFERAAWFIYLNRTCWNGLYRVNRKNEFNVPIGTKTNVILETDKFDAIRQRLERAEIVSQDFESTIDRAREGDFVFVDPPYTVKHNLNGFLKYNDKIFSWKDQVRLRDAVARASARGASVLVTNANHHSVQELYAGLGEQRVLSRSSVLAAKSAHRVKTEELTIRTWLPPTPSA